MAKQARRVTLPQPEAAPVGPPPGASPAPRTKVYRNVSSGEADEPCPEEVTIRDPRHPLFGRCFVVLRRLARRAGNVLPSFEVEHRGGGTLLIPEAACEPPLTGESDVKLSVEGLRELISLAGSLDAHADQSRGAVGHASAGAAAAGCGGHRRDLGGGSVS